MPGVTRDETFYLNDKGTKSGDQPCVWIFDADDTLWEDNLLFERIIEGVIDHSVQHGCELPREQLRALIDDIERVTMSEHGYGAPGFELSMRRAVERVREDYVKDLPACDALLDSIQPILVDEPRTIIEGTVATLEALRGRGHATVLYTKGPLDIQLSKVARSELEHLFDAVSVVQKKDAEHLSRLLKSLSFRSNELRSVGNSLKSDITPAVELGIPSFYFVNEHTWHFEDKHSLPDGSFTTIKSMQEVLDHA